MFRDGDDFTALQSHMKEVAFGLRYSDADLDSIQGRLLYYARGYYSQGGHSRLGIVIGRVNMKDWDQESTSETPIIDPHLRRNFGTTDTPSEEINVGQRGTLELVLGEQTPQTSKPLWTLPLNDSFVLGAIHFGNDIYLATDRNPSKVFTSR